LRRLFLLLLVVAVGYAAWDRTNLVDGLRSSTGPGEERVARAFRDHASNVQVSGKGVVSRILPDDNDGSRHQRFILKLSTEQTLLIAHNIDLAPRIASLREGDSVEFNGVYEWNSKGGVVHWTHHDPEGRHEAGWLKHSNKIYE
jgi:hypothetical protein